jgi:hypothetical protein
MAVLCNIMQGSKLFFKKHGKYKATPVTGLGGP